VQSLGELNLWQISMKPGKPFAFGRITVPSFSPAPVGGMSQSDKGVCFVGLPGNPVSSFMTFVLLVRPLILKLQGASRAALQTTQPIAMRADFDVPRSDKRREFLRVRRNDAGGLDLFPNQSSGVLTSTVWGDGVVDNPAGQTIKQGDRVSYVSFSELLN
jgi:molybdopterin molybdotransferase